MDTLVNNDYQLIASETLNNTVQYHLCGRPKYYYQDTCIVLQGLVDHEIIRLVEFAIARYSMCYPVSPIVVSTWTKVDKEIKERLLSLSKVHDQLSIIFSEAPSFSAPGNSNLQIVSTNAGLRVANEIGCSYVLKQRTDQLFGCFDFLKNLRIYHNSFPLTEAHFLNGRIVVGSLGSFKCRPFCVSDFFSFGYVSDMIKMWKLPLMKPDDVKVSPKTTRRRIDDVIPMEKSIELHLNMVAASKAGEPYVISNLLKNSPYSYSHDWKDSQDFLASSLIIVDSSSLVQFWPKYGLTTSYSKYKSGHAWGETFSKNPYGLSEISFADWLIYYRQYTETLN